MDTEPSFVKQASSIPPTGMEHQQPLAQDHPSMSTHFEQTAQAPVTTATGSGAQSNDLAHSVSHGTGAYPSRSHTPHQPQQHQSMHQSQTQPSNRPVSRAAMKTSAPPTPKAESNPTWMAVPRGLTPPPSMNNPPARSANTPDRALNVTDALSYLDAVKNRFQDRPDVYNRFLDIMKDFKTQVIDTPGVIERVSQLFNAHPDLIHGFNTFLPVGYRIEPGNDGTIVVRTPIGTSQITNFTPGGSASAMSRNAPSTYHSNGPASHPLNAPQQGSYHPGPADANAPYGVMSNASPSTYPIVSSSNDMMMQGRPGEHGVDQQFQRAIAFVNKIKNRYASEPETYKTFLELLQSLRDGTKSDVQQQIDTLLKSTPDLQAELKEFMPDGHSNSILGSVISATEWPGQKRKEPSSGLPAPAPKRKKKLAEKEIPSSKPSSSRQPKKTKHPQRMDSNEEYMYDANGIVSTSGSMGHMTMGAMGMSTPDDQAFFERVKKTLDNRETYDEFLKLINMFTQDIIDMRTLIDKATYFLGEGTELSVQFRRIIGWEERERLVREPDDPSLGAQKNLAIYVPQGKEDLHHKCGPSYRRIPANEAHIACSGRDELCRSVLNDEWVSHPTWASEDNSGFQSHKKNVYEEALHKCEEERHEFDFHLEIMSKTISALENINMKIQQMTNEEKATFKLKPGLGLPNKSIYQRIIKKVYGKEPGMEVIATLHDCPAIAVPIVLQRLKAKDEDWRRAQREWNKVWREVDARNFYKSLDHQGVTFKSTDKKAMTTKSLVSAIEAARDEQLSERAALMDPSMARTKPSHQLAYEITDVAVMKDATKLVLSYLDRLGALYTSSERDKIEKWIIDFLIAFFVLDKADFEDGLKEVNPSHDVAGAGAGALGVSNMVPVNAAVTAAMEVDAEEAESSQGGGQTSVKGKPLSEANNTDLRKGVLTKSAAGSRMQSAKPSPHIPATDLPAVKDDNTMPVDSVWIATQLEPQVPVSDMRSTGNSERRFASERKATFFGNTIAYVVLRIFQTLYSRLLLCKEITALLATGDESHKANPIAHELGMIEGLGPGTMNLFVPNSEMEVDADGTPINPVSKFYDHLLECCENLFAGDIDQNTFEENLRFMFGTKAYLMFTVDKVIAALIKQVHMAITDPHTEELLILLKKERQAEAPTTQQIITYRRNAEDIVSHDDNLFRINWNQGIMTVQLLGKSDPSTDDAETIAQRWRFYIESYVLTHPTEGVRKEVKNPFLRRNVIEAPLTETGCHAHNGLEIRVCIRTYRLFFVSDTEDYFWRYGDGARKQAMEKLPSIEEKRKASFESWLEAKRAKLDKNQNGIKKDEVVLAK